jgi:hypothetical protein
MRLHASCHPSLTLGSGKVPRGRVGASVACALLLQEGSEDCIPFMGLCTSSCTQEHRDAGSAAGLHMLCQ